MKTIFTLILSLFITAMFAQVSFDADVTEGCYPLTVDFTNTTTGIQTGDYFIWQFWDNNSAEITSVQTFEGTYVFEHPGTYYVKLIMYNYLDQDIGGVGPFEIKVFGLDSMNISTGIDACPGEKVWFEAQIIDYQDNNEIKWVFEDDTLNYSTFIDHVFEDVGTYNVQLMAHSNTCGWDTVNQTIEITNSATPIVDFYSSGGNEICYYDEMNFYSQYPAESYLWNFDDGVTDTIKDASHIFTNTGGKNVTLTATNICGNSASKTHTITVRDDIEAYADFDYDNYGICPNTPIEFHAQSNGTYNWTFDTIAISTLRNPKILFSDTGYYQVQLIYSNGCGNVDTSKVNDFHVTYDINNRPDAYINFNMNNSNGADTVNICPGQEVSFNNNTYPVQSVDYIWYFGDGDTSVVREPTHIFNTTSEIMLIAQNQCMGKDTAKLWVNIDMTTQPTSQLGILPDTICPGENVYFIDYNSNSNHFIDNNHNYSLDFGDGQSLSNPSVFTDSLLPIFFHEYESLGAYNYTFSVENQCGNSIEKTGTVEVLDNAHVPNQYLIYNPTDPTYGGEGEGCPNDSIIFMAFGGDSYQWHFGDGGIDTGRIVYHAYADTGIYNGYVVVTTNCGEIDTMETIVKISGNNIPDIYFDIYGSGSCSGDTAQFLANDHGVSSEFYTYNWFVDGDSVANGIDVNYIFDHGGDFDIKLEATNGCGTGEIHRHVFINSPILSFTVDDNVVIPSENVVFTNSSTNASTYLWDFGDGNTSTSASPTHSYTEYGYYDITLTGTNSDGCSYTETWSNYILVSDLVVNTNITDVRCNGESNGRIDISVTGGLPPYSIYCEETGAYSNYFEQLVSGYYHVKITDGNGTIINKTYYVAEPDPINITYDFDPITCFGYDDGKIWVTATGGTGMYNYQWAEDENISGYYEPLNLNYDTIANLSVGYNAPTPQYSVTVTDENGCSGYLDGFSLQLVPNTPFYGISHGAQTCGGSGTNVTIYKEPFYNHDISVLWNDASTALIRDPMYAGIYYLTITDDETGCVDETSLTLNNDDALSVYLTGNYKLNVCEGDADGIIELEVQNGSGNYSYQWSSNVLPANIINEHLIYHLPAGEYNLTVTDNSTSCETYKHYTVTEVAAPILTFETINPTCYGGYTGSSKVLPYSDGYSYYYSWSNGSTNQEIINRPAGTYSVTVTDADNACTSTGMVTIVNPPQMSLDIYSSNITSYGANNGVVSVLVNNGAPYYDIMWSEGYTGSTVTGLSPNTYTVTVTDVNECVAYGSAIITEPEMIDITMAVSDTLFCYGETATLTAPTGSNYSFEWSTGDTTQNITVGETGTYVLTVFDGISMGQDSVDITVSHPYNEEKICMVTVDTASLYNMVIWEKTPNVGIVSYNIYKLFGSQYMAIGSKFYDEMSVFIDSSSQPNVHADRYKISVIDTCGNESDLSPYHQTMYMGISDNNLGGNTVIILDWDDAIIDEGAEAIDWYYVYKGITPTSISQVDSVSGVFTGWNDYSPSGALYYRVVFNATHACIPTSADKTSGGPYSHSLSNLDDYGVETQLFSLGGASNITVYPNPFNTVANVTFTGTYNKLTFKLVDFTGRTLIEVDRLTKSNYILDGSSLAKGIYFVEFNADNKIYRKKVVLN